jgi:hypothetical protein
MALFVPHAHHSQAGRMTRMMLFSGDPAQIAPKN